MQQPYIFKLDTGKSDILDNVSKNNLILSSTINLPLSSLGFHTFIHRTKSAMNITKNLETKNKFYYVVNPFEHIIPNYDDSLKNISKIYLELKDNEIDILSRSFYKMWEMLFLFDLANKKDLTYAAIAEGPGAFIQAVINYREKLGNGIKNDKIFSVTIHSEKDNYIEMGKQFIGHYNKLNPGLLNIHKTVTIAESKKHKSKDNGDITQIKTISLFKKDIEKSKNYADLITADGNLDWDDDNFEEQEGYQLILGEIIAGLKVQAKDGNFVLKIFESFTIPTLKMIYILSSFYEETYLYKPYFSRPSKSEKYLICKGFKFDQKKDGSILDKKINILEKILEGMNSNKFVFDILPDLILPFDYIDKFKFMNIKISNPQQIMINQIVTYIKENNYFGDKYHLYREKQIEATKWWVNNFYPPSNNLYEKNKEELQKFIKLSIDKLAAEQNKFVSSIVR